MPIATTAATIAAAAATTNVDTSNLMLHVNNQLERAGFDLKSLIKAVDLSTVGLLTLLVIAGVFLYDLFTYGYSSYLGDTSSYTSYGRSLVTGAAKVWDQRQEYGWDGLTRGSRGLDSMTQILDSLADAVLKYEGENNTIGSSRQTKEMKNV